MLSNQLLQKTVDKIKSISGMEIAVFDMNGKLMVRTSADDIADTSKVAAFSVSSAKEFEDANHKLFKVEDESREIYILSVTDSTPESTVVGRMAKYQIETFLAAYKERFDKDNFFKSLLMDNMLLIDIFDRAKKLHIDMEAFRAAMIIEIGNRRHAEVIEEIRNLFPRNSEDFVTAINNYDIIVIKRVNDADSYDQLHAAAQRIQNALKSEGEPVVKVAFGSIVSDIKDVSTSYKEAKMALDVCRIFYDDQTVSSYNKLDIGRLIYQLPIPLCKLFLKEIFGDMKIDELDKETITTINKFFENSLNVSETSRQLFIHRNTLVYRLDKIQKLTGLDLRVFEDAITFKIALMVSRYMKYVEEQQQ